MLEGGKDPKKRENEKKMMRRRKRKEKRKRKGRRRKEEEEKERAELGMRNVEDGQAFIRIWHGPHPLFFSFFLFPSFLGVCCLLPVTFISSARQRAPPGAGAGLKTKRTKRTKPTITRKHSPLQVQEKGVTRLLDTVAGGRYEVRGTGPTPLPSQGRNGAGRILRATRGPTTQ